MNESRVISNEEGKKIADEFKIPYFETSAKSNIGVEEVFTYLVKEVDTIYMNEHKEEVGRKTVLNQKTKNKKKKCC